MVTKTTVTTAATMTAQSTGPSTPQFTCVDDDDEDDAHVYSHFKPSRPFVNMGPGVSMPFGQHADASFAQHADPSPPELTQSTNVVWKSHMFFCAIKAQDEYSHEARLASFWHKHAHDVWFFLSFCRHQLFGTRLCRPKIQQMGLCATRGASTQLHQDANDVYMEAMSVASMLPCRYCDEQGCNALACRKPQCFMMVKSHAVTNLDAIVKFLQENGVVVLAHKVIQDAPIAKLHSLYADHMHRWYFKRLIDSVSGGVVPMAVRSADPGTGTAAFIVSLRKLVGPTDPVKARGDAPHTLRGTLTTDEEMPHNVVHCSDSEDAAREELALFF